MSMFNLCLRVKNDRKIIYNEGLENSLRKFGGDMYEKDTIEVRQCYSGCICFYTALHMLAQVFKYELPETGCKRVVVKGAQA